MASIPVFLKNTTNIFPMANDSSGGQLCTEYNLLGASRVMTGPASTFQYGPSYTRTKSDFEVSSNNSSSLQISPGWAVVNGYFLCSEGTITFDIAEWNADHPNEKLSGSLVVGLKTVFSGQIATQDSLSVDETSTMYSGIQLVVISASNAKTPLEAKNLNEVTIDLKLASFEYTANGSVQNVQQNDAKIAYIDYRRILNSVSEEGGEGGQAIYPDISGTVPNRIYGLSPYNDNGWTYWDDITDLLFRISASKVILLPIDDTEEQTEEQKVYLKIPRYVPHTSQSDSDNFILISFPDCDYDKNKPGMASSDLIQKVKDAVSYMEKLEADFKGTSILNVGKIVAYLPIATSVDDITTAENIAVPTPTEADIGKLLLVGQDMTQVSGDSLAPTTIYVVYADTATNTTQYKWSNDPVIMRPEIPLATQDTIGGVKNIDLVNDAAAYTDKGYVYIDAEGHMRIRDYALLRSGLLAYALTADYLGSSQLTSEEIQSELDNYVNNRIAMPKTTSGEEGNLDIHVTIPSVSGDLISGGYLIQNIDSRFGASVHLHLEDISNTQTSVTIMNCEKVVIYMPASSTLTVQVINSGVYYSSNVMENSNVVFLGCNFWYDSSYASKTGMISQYISVVDNKVYMSENATVNWIELSEYYLHANDQDADIHVFYLPHHFTLDDRGRIIDFAFTLKSTVSVQNISNAENTEIRNTLRVDNFTLPFIDAFVIPINRIPSKLRFTTSYGIAYKSTSDGSFRAFKSQFSSSYDPSSEKGGVLYENIETAVYVSEDVSIDDGVDTDLLKMMYPQEVVVTGVPDTL